MTDAQTGNPLEAVNIGLEGTPYGTSTNASGQFTITDVPAGSYKLVLSFYRI